MTPADPIPPPVTPEPLSAEDLAALERKAKSECNEYRESFGRATCALRTCLIRGGWVSGRTAGHEPMCDAKLTLRLIAQARAARPSPWQPIAEHNKTPFPVLVGWVDGASVERGIFDRHMANGMWRSADKRGNPLFDPQPTHFQPLPFAPRRRGGGA